MPIVLVVVIVKSIKEYKMFSILVCRRTIQVSLKLLLICFSLTLLNACTPTTEPGFTPGSPTPVTRPDVSPTITPVNSMSVQEVTSTPSPALTITPLLTQLSSNEVFAGAIEHRYRYIGQSGESVTLSYLTDVGSESHLAQLQDLVHQQFGEDHTIAYMDGKLFPVFSPDDQLMAFHVVPVGDLPSHTLPALTVINRKGDIVHVRVNTSFSRWTPDSTGYFSTSYDELLYLVYLDDRPEVVFTDMPGVSTAYMSPDGQTILYKGQDNNLWQTNIGGARGSTLLDLATSHSITPIWSPDGRWLVVRNGVLAHFLNLETGEKYAEELYGGLVWSTDSQQIILSGREIKNNQVSITRFEPVDRQKTEIWLPFPANTLDEDLINLFGCTNWLPGDRELVCNVYSTKPDGAVMTDIWFLSLNGNTLQQMTHDSSEKHQINVMP